MFKHSRYEPNENLSQIQLLDLAYKSMADSNTGEQHSSVGPFDMILSYLDLNSLQSLSKTNRKCIQLVDSYVKQHSEKQGTFTMTNEICVSINLDYKRLNEFRQNFVELRNMIEQIYHII